MKNGHRTKTIAIFSGLLSMVVIIAWVLVFARGAKPDGTIEFMAGLCITGEIFLLLKTMFGAKLNIVGLGLVVYSLLNAAGYYGAQDNVLAAVVFAGVYQAKI